MNGCRRQVMGDAARAAAGAAQSRRQRHQVHLDRRRRADRRTRHLAERNQLPGARHRHRHRARGARARIFREFEQADDRIARSYGGTGLGPSISDRIVKRMGGRITLESSRTSARHSKCRSRSRPPIATRRPSWRRISPASSIMLVSPQEHRGFARPRGGCSAGAARPAWYRIPMSREAAAARAVLARDADRSRAWAGRYRTARRSRAAACHRSAS